MTLRKACACEATASGPRVTLRDRDGSTVATSAALACDACGAPWVDPSDNGDWRRAIFEEHEEVMSPVRAGEEHDRIALDLRAIGQPERVARILLGRDGTTEHDRPLRGRDVLALDRALAWPLSIRIVEAARLLAEA